jgi:ABC-2 type transport system permease protein
MNGLTEQFLMSLRLYFRNKMGMFYGYLFPAIFLLAFRVLYRNELVPVSRHLGQLLTVTVLGGACLGMPTTMVSERERGVWRRYRLTPVSTPALVTSAVAVRFLIVITAGLLQIALAMSIGMPLPKHPLDLSIAFAFVAFAFLGLGLVVATIADNVPSVQALGQCIFLPMLIIGGVAVPLDTLPDWAQHVAAFFPGRYAVESLQASITGPGTQASHFDFLALLLIGAAGMIAGAKMFRWEAQQRFAARNKGWLTAVIAAWTVVGLAAEARGRVATGTATPAANIPIAAIKPTATEPAPDPTASTPAPTLAHSAPAATGPANPGNSFRSTVWQEVTVAEINRNTDFHQLPPDNDVVAPIARRDLAPPDDIVDQLNTLKSRLPDWPYGRIEDPVQRVRNLLYVAAVPDVLRSEILEGYVPWIVFDQLQKTTPKDDLIRLLYWVAVHPSAGDATAATQMESLGLENAPGDTDAVRERVSVYAMKLLGRLIGKIPTR